jgi:protein-tyrosine kinase
MSKFFKALKQAEEDRVRREEDHVGASRAAPEREPLVLRRSDAIADEPAPAPAPAPPVRTQHTARPAPHSEPSAPDEAIQAQAPVSPGASELLRPSYAKGSPNGAAPVEEHLVSLLAPTSFETEQYRTLRTLLEARRGDGGPRVIAISSPAVGDGKTTTAINLAGVLGEGEDSRVLLIDADLRNPSIGQRLGIAPSVAGLTQVLRGRDASLDGLATRRHPFNIDVLVAGESSKAPYELFKSPSFSALLSEARRRYEFVIIDTPPIVSLPDCRLICGFVDGFIVVVAAHRTPKKMVEEALNSLDPEKVIGFIFNSDEQPLSGYRYYYPYGETYGPSRGRRGKHGENA